MHWALFVVAIMTAQVVASPIAYAQTDLQRAQNLATCLSGKYPSLCKHEWLTPEEMKKVEAAERQENLKTCLTGRYPSLCRKDKLTAEELKQVVAAEKRENLKDKDGFELVDIESPSCTVYSGQVNTFRTS